LCRTWTRRSPGASCRRRAASRRPSRARLGLLCPAPIKPHPVASSPACRHHPAPRHRLVCRRRRRRFAGVKPDRRKPPPPESLQRRAEALPLFIGLVPPPEHRRPRRHEPAAQAPPSAAPSSNLADSICLHHSEPLYNHPLDLLFQFDASAKPETAQGAGDPNNQSPPCPPLVRAQMKGMSWTFCG
jgi:hypothetical protein